MTVTAQTPYNVSTANGVATTFAYTFLLLDADDLVVRVDGVTVTTGFTVTGVGTPSGGTVEFDTAPSNGSEVLRLRSTRLIRETDYQTSGDFKAEVVDPDFDRLWLGLQDLNALIGFIPRFWFSLELSGFDATLPDPVAGYALFTNDDGSALEWREPGSVDFAIPGDQTVTVAKMSASATDVVFGRSTAGAGAGEEIPCTAAGRALMAGASASAQRTTLGLGAVALLNSIGSGDLPAATTSAQGAVEQATDAEVIARTAGKFPDASQIKKDPGVAKKVMRFAGRSTDGTCTFTLNKGGTARAERKGAPYYRVLFSSSGSGDDMQSGEYVISGSVVYGSAPGTVGAWNAAISSTAANTGVFSVVAQDATGFVLKIENTAELNLDPDFIHVVIHDDE